MRSSIFATNVSGTSSLCDSSGTRSSPSISPFLYACNIWRMISIPASSTDNISLILVICSSDIPTLGLGRPARQKHRSSTASASYPNCLCTSLSSMINGLTASSNPNLRQASLSFCIVSQIGWGLPKLCLNLGYCACMVGCARQLFP